jgi:hypothetical protein
MYWRGRLEEKKALPSPEIEHRYNSNAARDQVSTETAIWTSQHKLTRLNGVGGLFISFERF